MRPDPDQAPRLQRILANLRDRATEAEHHGWRGEIAGLEVSIAAAEQKLAAMHALASRHNQTSLGMPNFRTTTARATAPTAQAPPCR